MGNLPTTNSQQDIFDRLNQLNQQAAEASANASNLNAELKKLLALVASLENQLSSLSGQRDGLEAEIKDKQKELAAAQKALAEAEKEKPQKPGEVDALKKQIEGLNNQLTSLNAQLGAKDTEISKVKAELDTDKQVSSSKQTELDKVNTQLKAFLLDRSLQVAQDALKKGEKAEKAEQANEISGTATSSTTPPQTPEQKAKEASALIDKMVNSSIELGQLAIKLVNDIANNEKDIEKTKARIEELQHEIVKDSIALVACALFFGIGAGYAAYKLAKDVMERDSLKGKVTELENTIKELKAKLKETMQELVNRDAKDLGKDLEMIMDLVTKLLGFLSNQMSGGAVGRDATQEAGALAVEVLALVQTISAKVHKKRDEDRQMMSEGMSKNFEMGVNKSQVALGSIIEAQQYAAFMKTFMTIVKVVMVVVSLVIAAATGGTAAFLIAALFAALTLSGVMEMATEKLAQAIDKNGSGWSKVLAEIIVVLVTIAVTIVAAGAGSSILAGRLGQAVGGKAAEQVAKAAAQKALQGAEQAAAKAVAEAASSAAAKASSKAAEVAAKTANNIANDVAQSAARAAGTKAATKGATEAVTKAGSEASKTGANVAAKEQSALGKFWDRATMDGQIKYQYAAGTLFLGNNGLVDAMQMFAEFFKSKKDLEKDTVFQILKIVMAVIQAIAAMVSGAKMVQGSGGQSVMEQAMNKFGGSLNRTQVMQVLNMLQFLTGSLAVGGSGLQADNKFQQADLTKKLGDAQLMMIFGKDVIDSLQTAQKSSSEEFAHYIQRQMMTLNQTIQLMAVADHEAARLEAAV